MSLISQSHNITPVWWGVIWCVQLLGIYYGGVLPTLLCVGGFLNRGFSCFLTFTFDSLPNFTFPSGLRVPFTLWRVFIFLNHCPLRSFIYVCVISGYGVVSLEWYPSTIPCMIPPVVYFFLDSPTICLVYTWVYSSDFVIFVHIFCPLNFDYLLPCSVWLLLSLYEPMEDAHYLT